MNGQVNLKIRWRIWKGSEHINLKIKAKNCEILLNITSIIQLL